MKNNCQDFSVGLAQFLDPKISAGVFPSCEAGKNLTVTDEDDVGFASAAAGQGQEFNIFNICGVIFLT